LKNIKKAIEICKNAISIDPNSSHLKFIYVIYANAEDKLGNGSRSLQIYEEGIDKFPNFQQLHFNKAIALIGLKDYDEAFVSLHQSAILKPSHITTHNAIGRIVYYDNKIPALFAFCQVMIIDPTSSLAKENFTFVQEIMKANVEKTGKNAITININPIDTTAGKENNFSAVETMLSFSAATYAMASDDKKKKKKKEEY